MKFRPPRVPGSGALVLIHERRTLLAPGLVAREGASSLARALWGYLGFDDGESVVRLVQGLGTVSGDSHYVLDAHAVTAGNVDAGLD